MAAAYILYWRPPVFYFGGRHSRKWRPPDYSWRPRKRHCTRPPRRLTPLGHHTILLSVCGISTFRLIKSLLAPVKLETKSFQDLVNLVEKHHNPEPSATVQRFKFHSRSRQPKENVAQYVAELRRIAERCRFGDNLENVLCDRLVCGIQDSRIQRRLLAEPDLTFGKAFELAQALESADRDAKTLLAVPPSVHAVTDSRNPQNRRSNSKKPDRPCYRCGPGQHWDRDCRFKDAECRNCKKKGHIARACRSRPPQPITPRKNNSRQPRQQRTNLLTNDRNEDLEEAETDPVYSLFNVSDRSAKPIIIDVHLSQVPLKMELDTGASVSMHNQSGYLRQTLVKDASSFSHKVRYATPNLLRCTASSVGDHQR